MPGSPVSFTSNGMRLAGLYFARSATNGVNGAKAPSIVIGHPGGGVKEQTVSTYASRLSERGSSALRAEDIKAAVSYLSTRDDVDEERIGALGICASGAYVPFAAQSDQRIKAIATISAVDLAEMFRTGRDGQQTVETMKQNVSYSGSLRTAEAKGQEPEYSDIGRPNREQGGEAFEYYFTPLGQHPRSTNKQLTRSIDRLVTFDAYHFMSFIAPRPILMIVESEAFSKPTSEAALAKLESNKELFVIDGATHMSLYYKHEHVTPAVDKLVDFFGKSLNV